MTYLSERAMLATGVDTQPLPTGSLVVVIFWWCCVVAWLVLLAIRTREAIRREEEGE